MRETNEQPTLGRPKISFESVNKFYELGLVGVPLLADLLGERAAGPAIVALAIDMVVTSSLCIALSRPHGANGQGVSSAVGNALKGMLRTRCRGPSAAHEIREFFRPLRATR